MIDMTYLNTAHQKGSHKSVQAAETAIDNKWTPETVVAVMLHVFGHAYFQLE
jgi:hypothetical protein